MESDSVTRICSHGGMVSISNPIVVQLNWRGFDYNSGAWGQDYSPWKPDKGLYWVAPLKTDKCMEYYRLHNTLDDLVLYTNYQQQRFTFGQGSGRAVYNSNKYVNLHNSQFMARVDLTASIVIQSCRLLNAAYKNRFSYANVDWQDMDFAVDELGLWVVYSTEANTGYMMISKLNDTTLEVLNTWQTRQYKPSVSNSFMVCGVLYATHTLNTRIKEIFYYYDTSTGKEGHLDITMCKMQEKVQSIKYHPFEQKLFVVNNGYLLSYGLVFLKKLQ
nr:LOW QUALITY PROTEIN: olfactomedin-4 [Dasypus novemcinctus]